ncbi:HNH endonuclease signature motif containing protein [Nocardioides sambongensis]|uniref:HNH endonuclease signature motif containing protein n=1 Tax=Nocardioides sambongensis TaxID=2589074 RepID=UPI0018C88DE7|nr:HNH endonuclease signature motif containing protein [Nocardioides sambongensis]
MGTLTEALRTVSAAVDALASAEQAQPVASAELVEVLALAARTRAVLDGVMVGLAEALEEHDVAHELGWASTKELLTHATGGRKGSGTAWVRVAQQTQELPAVRDALTQGRISFAQAGVIGRRVATLPHVPELREDAAALLLDRVAQAGVDATDLDHAFGDVVRELDPDGELLRADLDKPRAERGAHHARFLSFAPDHLGGVRIKGYATIEETELVKTILMPLAAPATTEPGACGGTPLPDDGPLLHDPNTPSTRRRCPEAGCRHDGRDPREAGVRMWDALVELATRYQATDQLPRAHGTTARITITMNLADLTEKAAGADPAGFRGIHHTTGLPDPTSHTGHLPTGTLTGGHTLSALAIRRLACDAEIIPAILGTHNEILDLGRSTRTVTPGLWNALVLRDQHCAFPGCTRLPLACDAHHIQHWADAGPTSLDNLILLCRRHHTTAHHTPWTITINPDTGQPHWQPPPPTPAHQRVRIAYTPGRPPPHAA